MQLRQPSEKDAKSAKGFPISSVSPNKNRRIVPLDT